MARKAWKYKKKKKRSGFFQSIEWHGFYFSMAELPSSNSAETPVDGTSATHGGYRWRSDTPWYPLRGIDGASMGIAVKNLFFWIKNFWRIKKECKTTGAEGRKEGRERGRTDRRKEGRKEGTVKINDGCFHLPTRSLHARSCVDTSDDGTHQGKGKRCILAKPKWPKTIQSMYIHAYLHATSKWWSSYYRLVPTTPYILKLAMIDGTSPVCNRGLRLLLNGRNLFFFSAVHGTFFLFWKTLVFDSLVSTGGHSRWRK